MPNTNTFFYLILLVSIMGFMMSCGTQQAPESSPMTSSDTAASQPLLTDSTAAEPVPNSQPELTENTPKPIEGTNLVIEPVDPEAAPALPIKNVAVPNAGPVAIKTASLPVTNDCITKEKEWSFQLNLLAEKLEKQDIMYSQTPADALADCSGIFFRIARFAATACQNYQYPDPKKTRDSRAVARWFHDHNNLVIVQDAKTSRNLIRPGSVMFYGRSGERYADITLDKIAGTPQQRGVITHMGVVTQVDRDQEGNVIGYVMMHGRRKGVTAQRSHYHKIEPPRFGFPVLGNWNQQWVAVANLMTPASAEQVIAVNEAGDNVGEDVSTSSGENTPATNLASLPAGQACGGEEKAWSKQLTVFAESLEKKNLMYTQSPPELLQDCSGIFFRMARFAESQCDQYQYPDPTKTRDSRSLARWYHDHGNLAIVHDPLVTRNLIKPGSVMFFGRSGERYSNLTIDRIAGTPQTRGVITHVGVVTEVKYDAAGKVIGYIMMHGSRPGKPAKRSHYHQVAPPKIGLPPLGNYNQQWVAVANIMTPEGGGNLAARE